MRPILQVKHFNVAFQPVLGSKLFHAACFLTLEWLQLFMNCIVVSFQVGPFLKLLQALAAFKRSFLLVHISDVTTQTVFARKHHLAVFKVASIDFLFLDTPITRICPLVCHVFPLFSDPGPFVSIPLHNSQHTLYLRHRRNFSFSRMSTLLDLRGWSDCEGNTSWCSDTVAAKMMHLKFRPWIQTWNQKQKKLQPGHNLENEIENF